MRILIADDHALMRRQIRQILESEPGFVVCAEASTGIEAVALAASELPEIAVLDLAMPQMDGAEAARQIHRRFPWIGILIVTMYDPSTVMDGLVESNVRTVIPKTDFYALPAAIRRVWQEQQGQRLASPTEHTPQKTGDTTSIVTPAVSLTPVEKVIVQMIAHAKSNTKIAASLSLTVKAVETSRADIMCKLKISSIVELVRYALQNDLVSTKK